MRRKLPGETAEPDRKVAVNAAAAPVKVGLEEWAARGAADLLRSIHPTPISGFNPRQNDIAEVLLAIAQLAGGGWPQRLSEGLKVVCKATKVEDASIGATLLTDIHTVFDEHETDTISSKMMTECLCEIEGRPWAEWSHGKVLTANNLARQLKKFKIYPVKIRLGPTETAQGYRREDFVDAWSRYCALSPIQTGTTEQPASLLAKTALSKRNTHTSVPVTKSASTPHEQKSVPVVPVQNRGEAVSEVRI
jgi:putative DNA primase/helicase